MNVVKATVNLDVSVAISGLKALQREARETVQVLREVESASDTGAKGDDKFWSYMKKIQMLRGDNVKGDEANIRYINRQLYHAIGMDDMPHITIHHQSGDGAILSAFAAMATFDDVVCITQREKMR